MPLGKKPFENTVGKGEIARNEQFLLYPVFFTFLQNFLLFSSNLKFLSADCFNLDQSKICRLEMDELLYTISWLWGTCLLTFYLLCQFFGSSNSPANKDIMSKIWTIGNTIFWLSRKHCGKRRNCSLQAISSFPTMFSNAVCCSCVKMSIDGVRGKKT